MILPFSTGAAIFYATPTKWDVKLPAIASLLHRF